MTTIVYRDGVMAADSRVTTNSEAGGSRAFRCEKLYRIPAADGRIEAIIGLAGESFPGLVFLEWMRKGGEKPTVLLETECDFTALVYSRKGLFEFDRWCVGERVLGRFYAIGSGAKAALGALHMGANARTAVKVACKIDPYSAGPIISMGLT